MESKGIIAVSLNLLLATTAMGLAPIPGWEPVSETWILGPAELWEYIDGAAEHYLAYGFRELRAKEMRRDCVGVTLQVYDLAPSDGALEVGGSRGAGALAQGSTSRRHCGRANGGRNPRYCRLRRDSPHPRAPEATPG